MTLLRRVFTRLVQELNLYRVLHLRKSKTISVLTYHGVTDVDVDDYCFIERHKFENQIKYLSKNFEVLSIMDAFKKDIDYKKPRAIITFDDGFYNNYKYAFPILKKYNVPATIFLSTAFINTKNSIWFCYVNDMIEKTNKKGFYWNGENYSLLTSEDRLASSNKIQSLLKSMSIEDIYSQLNTLSVLLSVEMTDLSDHYRMLDSLAISDMGDSGLIEFGAHTHNHVILTTANEHECQREIIESVNMVHDLTGNKCRYFAYPNGCMGDFSSDHKAILREAGIEYAFTMINGLSSHQEDREQIRRLFISSSFTNSKFASVIHGY